MLNKPNILVCSDFSAASDRALMMAYRLSTKSKGKITLLHVAEATKEPLAHAELIEKAHAQCIRCQVEAFSEVVFGGNTIQEIKKECKEKKIDLVVIGHQGTSGLTGFLIGSVARKLASASPVPVLVVKRDRRMEKIAALVAGKDDSKEIIDWSQELSFLTGTKLDVISVIPSPLGLYNPGALEYSGELLHLIRSHTEIEQQKLRQYLERLATPSANVIVLPSSIHGIAYQLVELLKSENIDLAIMKKHNKKALEHFFLGSITNRVLELYEGNVLVC